MPEVKAAVLERSRRSTAGKRMSSLVGKAQEDDDTFWNHQIWSESGGGFSKSSGKKRGRNGDSPSSESDNDSENDSSISDGEGSYRMSDEDSEAAVDQFDSDFDETESEDEEGEGEEVEEERELRAAERRAAAAKKKKSQRLGVPVKSVVSSAGRELIKRKQGKGGGGGLTRRGPVGEGWNAGLVLNWPPPAVDQTVPSQFPGATTLPAQNSSTLAAPSAGPTPAPVVNLPVSKPIASAQISMEPTKVASSGAVLQKIQPQQTTTNSAHIPVSTPVPPKTTSSPGRKRNLRAGTLSKSIATAQSVAYSTKLTQQRQAIINEKKKTNQKHQFTQEELILEAVKVTEAENAKWLSARKRVKEEAALLESMGMNKGKGSGGSSGRTTVSRFHSRRGFLNTLTFMDMDHLPEILSRKHVSARKGSFDHGSKRRTVDNSTVSSIAGIDEHPETKKSVKCVITGKLARYRDPKTMLGYHDISAFKELRRRLDAGELFGTESLHNSNEMAIDPNNSDNALPSGDAGNPN